MEKPPANQEMINPVSAPSAPSVVTERPTQSPTSTAAPEAQSQAAPDLRLTIDVAPKGSELVYTLTDRTTGRVVVQLPRQALVDLGARHDYAAGDLIGARV